MTKLIAMTFALMMACPAHALDEKKLVDLTYEFSAETHHWPTAKPFHLEKVAEGRTPGGFWYSSYNYGGSEHVGTHLDAPFHFAEGKRTAEQIPLSQLIGPGVVIDVSRQVGKDADYKLQLSDIARLGKSAWAHSHRRDLADSFGLGQILGRPQTLLRYRHPGRHRQSPFPRAF